MNEPNWPKITAETPIEEVQRIHKDIWQYVVENGEKPKTPYFANCVACDYAFEFSLADQTDSVSRCDACPINWGDLGYCGAYKSIYGLWLKLMRDANDNLSIYTPVDAMRIAVVIRDIPFKTNERSINNETANENP